MSARGCHRAIRRASGGIPMAALLAFALLAFALLAFALQAGAHTPIASNSSWLLDSDGATVTLRIPQIEQTRLPWAYVRGVNLDPNLAAYIVERLQLRSGGEPCPLRRMPQWADIVDAAPIQGIRITVNAFATVARSLGDPVRQGKCCAAKIFTKSPGIATATVAIEMLYQFDVGFR